MACRASAGDVDVGVVAAIAIRRQRVQAPRPASGRKVSGRKVTDRKVSGRKVTDRKAAVASGANTDSAAIDPIHRSMAQPHQPATQLPAVTTARGVPKARRHAQKAMRPAPKVPVGPMADASDIDVTAVRVKMDAVVDATSAAAVARAAMRAVVRAAMRAVVRAATHVARVVAGAIATVDEMRAVAVGEV